MADLPTVFSESAATRIGAATRWAELQQGIPQDGYGSSPGNASVLVKTGSILPQGYNGLQAVLGNLIEKNQSDFIRGGTSPTLIAPCWIKDVNDSKLGLNFQSTGRYAGTLTQTFVNAQGVAQDLTLPIYMVSVPVVAKTKTPELVRVTGPGSLWRSYDVYGPGIWIYPIHTYYVPAFILVSQLYDQGAPNPSIYFDLLNQQIHMPGIMAQNTEIFINSFGPIYTAVNETFEFISSRNRFEFTSFNRAKYLPEFVNNSVDRTFVQKFGYLINNPLSLTGQKYQIYYGANQQLTIVNAYPPLPSGIGSGIGSGISGV